MKGTPAALLLVLLFSAPLYGAGLDSPSLSPPLSTSRFFDPDRLLTTGGMKYSASPELTLEPELGVGYRRSEGASSGVEESVHRVHAQAGWRLSIPDTWYLSAAAKMPVLTIDHSESLSGQDLGSKRDYDLFRSGRNTPTWTGEMGIHLSRSTDLTLYYDQSPASGLLSSTPQQEERVGTRLIFRFK